MSTSTSALSLLQASADEGNLTPASMMAFQALNMGEQIQAGLGVKVDDVEASEVFLMAKVIDDSSSIGHIQADPSDPIPMNGPEAICFGSNLLDDALKESKSAADVLVSTRLLNRGLIDAFTPLSAATQLKNHDNYSAYGGTPLYDQTIASVGTVMAKLQEFEDAGVPARATVIIVTDGYDWGSSSDADDVAAVVKDAIRSENVIVYFMGIEDGSTDFVAVANSMGILAEFVLTPKKTATEIRAAFHTASQSNVRASQGGAGFSQAAGGFGA
jgi:hypothetical protein